MEQSSTQKSFDHEWVIEGLHRRLNQALLVIIVVFVLANVLRVASYSTVLFLWACAILLLALGQTVIATLMTASGYNRPKYGGARHRWFIVGITVAGTILMFLFSVLCH